MERIGTRALRGVALAAVAAGLAVLAAAPAQARVQWDYPLTPHVRALAFFPDPMTPHDAVTVVLSAAYSGECWSTTRAVVIDSEHVEVDLASCVAPPDSGSSWLTELVLGRLGVGSHTLHVHAKVAGLPDEDAAVPFDVIAYVPPPPPPGHDSTGTTRIAYVTATPDRPTITDVIHVEATGNVDFGCAQVANVYAHADTLSLTLRPSPACSDTAQMWHQGWDVGPLPAGTHVYFVRLAVEEPTTGFTEIVQAVGVTVADPNAPPPPTPGDSLDTVMSPMHPNPFSDRTSFSVSLKDPSFARVDVYDLGGRRVATVHTGVLPAGTTQLDWNGRRADGSRASGGIYFYRLVLPGRTVTRRVVLLETP